MKYFSQDGQDAFIVKLFRGERNGTFIDIGAFDGKTFSNTLYLEKELMWKGICIEPNPIAFKELKANRNCICINCGVGEKEGVFKFLSLSGASAMLSGYIDSFDENHINRIDQLIKTHGGKKELIEVPVLPFKIIAEKHNIEIVEYCNIDVEGGELNVLRSIDFKKVKIKVFTIENNNDSKEVCNFLKPFGYKLIHKLGADEVYELSSKRYQLILNYKIKKLKNALSELKHRFIK